MKYRELESYKFGLVEDKVIELIGYTGPTFKHDFFEICYAGNHCYMIGRKGYAWDGSSIPFKWLLGVFYEVEKYCKVPSLAHDIAYQAGRLGLLPLKYRDYFDKLYYKMMIQRGMPEGQARRRLWAVSKYSEKYFVPQKDKRDKIYEVY